MTTQKQIRYIADIKYSLAEDYTFESLIVVTEKISTYFFDIIPKGDETGSIWYVRRGYPWDGPSGPTVDTDDSLRGSLEHDLKYESIRKGLIDSSWRNIADDELKETCEADGMSHIRANLWHYGVSEFAEYASDPKNKKKILTAP